MKDGIKNVFSFHIVCWGALFTVIFFGGCRAKKEIQRREEITTEAERIERSVDSVRIKEISERSTEKNESELNQTYTRIIEYDTTGTVRRVQESWRNRQRIDLVAEERIGRTFSVSNSKKEIISRDTSSTIINEMVLETSDDRPVQGAEWLWVILGGAVIVIAIIIIKKR